VCTEEVCTEEVCTEELSHRGRGEGLPDRAVQLTEATPLVC
jgi:hypothetical protein